MRIKIIRIPEGEAPEEIRKEWVGCELPVYGYPKEEQTKEILSGTLRLKKGFLVPVPSALNILRKKSQVAAKWFEDHVSPPLDSIDYCFLFNEEECKIIDYEII